MRSVRRSALTIASRLVRRRHDRAPQLRPRCKHAVSLQINPQLGLDITYKDGPAGGHSRFGDLVPQLYVIYSEGRVNAESWNLYFFPLTDDGIRVFLTRQLVTMRLIGNFSLGPHFEAAWFEGIGIDRMAYGGDLVYGGDWGTVTVFLADNVERNVLESRFTYLRAF